MPFPFPKLGPFAPVLIVYLLIVISHGIGAKDSSNVTNIGAIINANGRIGKEQKTAMEIAAENFNNRSKTHKLILHFRDSGRDPFRAAYAAKELIKEKVEVIVGMETWNEAAQVADHANQSNVTVISFASPTITPPLIQRSWPYLMRMATKGSAQLKGIADIVSAYNWKRVVVVYEDDGYGGAVGMLAVLSEALRDVGSAIEHRLILPRVSSIHNPKGDGFEEMLNFTTIKSRVFIVIQSSLPTVTRLFQVAKETGLVGRDSAWIITEAVVRNLPDSLDNSDMEGTLGMKTDYANNTSSYKKFLEEFKKKFSDEDNIVPTPGIYALRAYDMMTIITQAIERMASNNSSTTSSSLQVLLKTLLNNYAGLSGEMHFKGGEVLFRSPTFKIINVVDGKRQRDVGPLESIVSQGTHGRNDVDIIWPGKITSAPKGWAMPTKERPMKILVPGITPFNTFVKVNWSRNNSDEKKFDGFCIELFRNIRRNLTYTLHYEIEALNCTYDSLIELVQNKTYDAVIGDVTVLADRLDKVDFTQPYMKSGLAMIVPEKDEKSTWLILKPFTWQMWAVSGGILLYTTLVVWFLEGPSNPEFGDGLSNQIRTATWFTFSSLFFAQREKIRSNFTRVVVIEWLFVVLILSSSYTANLSSMLTIKRLQPKVTDIEMLTSTKAKVGSDKDTFVKNYMQRVFGFDGSNVVEIGPDYNVDNFKNKNLSAAFLELPYAELFMNQNCKGYTLTTPIYRFGGFSFAFQKGSPIARDFTRVILELLENGKLKEIDDSWLTTKGECSRNATSDTPQSWSLRNFAGLYIITGVTSTFCLLFSLLRKFVLA